MDFWKSKFKNPKRSCKIHFNFDVFCKIIAGSYKIFKIQKYLPDCSLLRSNILLLSVVRLGIWSITVSASIFEFVTWLIHDTRISTKDSERNIFPDTLWVAINLRYLRSISFFHCLENVKTLPRPTSKWDRLWKCLSIFCFLNLCGSVSKPLIICKSPLVSHEQHLK